MAVCTTDLEKAKIEINILNLLKTKKQIFYKLYPEVRKRYYEDNPCIKFAKNINNVNIIKESYDARYLLKYSKLLICASASSTISWALLSERPVVFINFKYMAP